MPRTKGSKNKKRRADPYTVALRRVVPAPTVETLRDLSTDSGLPLQKVVDDCLLEGAALIRRETYDGLIEFNKRRGKVIHERDLEKNGGASEEAAPRETSPSEPGPFELPDNFENSPSPSSTGPDDASVESGLGASYYSPDGEPHLYPVEPRDERGGL